MHGHSPEAGSARRKRADNRPRSPGASSSAAAGLHRVPAFPAGAAPPTSPSARLRQLGLRPRKGLSQSFLADGAVARAIVAAARLDPERDEVLEVGPGLGILTERLVKRARRVVAVELDAELAAALPAAIPAPNLEIRQGDVLRFDPAFAFDEPYVVVANLPYHVTSPALRHLLAAGPPFARRLVVMVQREVADRVLARPGDLSSLAVSIQAQASVRLVLAVPSSAFHPSPKVESAVLVLDPLPDEKRLISRSDLDRFVAFVHAGFAQPRKVLANSLSQGLGRERSEVVPKLERVGVDPRRRPQSLSVAEWATLFRAFDGD